MPVATLAILVAVVAFTGCSGMSASQDGGGQFEVMNPWGDADPVPLRGISPRIDTLDN
jgi:ABC-type glycerol-3-phosphate transport system substrate-binding protein